MGRLSLEYELCFSFCLELGFILMSDSRFRARVRYMFREV